jgi:hypothetical protein
MEHLAAVDPPTGPVRVASVLGRVRILPALADRRGQHDAIPSDLLQRRGEAAGARLCRASVSLRGIPFRWSAASRHTRRRDRS